MSDLLPAVMTAVSMFMCLVCTTIAFTTPNDSGQEHTLWRHSTPDRAHAARGYVDGCPSIDTLEPLSKVAVCSPAANSKSAAHHGKASCSIMADCT
jgi:hypothetical protein